MSFDLSFSGEFFYGEGYSLDGPYPEVSTRPTSVLQALISLSAEEQAELREELEVDDVVAFDGLIAILFDKVRETNTCTNLDSPVEVWIDSQGWHTINVY